MASEYLKYRFRDEKRDTPARLTPHERRKNWWHYNKWYFIAGAVLLVILGDIGLNMARQLWEAPDYMAAYVGENALDESREAGIKEALTRLGEDLDGDGKVEVKLAQYIFPTKVDPEMAAASEVLLMGDVLECDSYFFFLEDPKSFQEKYHCLCRLDGSMPEDGDYSADGTYLEWGDGLYLARRVPKEGCKYPDGCGELWKKLMEDVSP